MPEVSINHRDVGGYHLVKLEGELDLANFTALFGVVKGYVRQRCTPVIIDLSGNLSISDELSKLKKGCLGLYGCPFDTSYLLFVIVSPQERFKKLQDLLELACPLRHKESIEEAVEMLNETQPAKFRP